MSASPASRPPHLHDPQEHPGAISAITGVLTEAHLNIENMVNKSKKDVAYTLLDVTGNVTGGSGSAAARHRICDPRAGAVNLPENDRQMYKTVCCPAGGFLSLPKTKQINPIAPILLFLRGVLW